jgi:hypothetical protein
VRQKNKERWIYTDGRVKNTYEQVSHRDVITPPKVMEQEIDDIDHRWILIRGGPFYLPLLPVHAGQCYIPALPVPSGLANPSNEIKNKLKIKMNSKGQNKGYRKIILISQ